MGVLHKSSHAPLQHAGFFVCVQLGRLGCLWCVSLPAKTCLFSQFCVSVVASFVTVGLSFPRREQPWRYGKHQDYLLSVPRNGHLCAGFEVGEEDRNRTRMDEIVWGSVRPLDCCLLHCVLFVRRVSPCA